MLYPICPFCGLENCKIHPDPDLDTLRKQSQEYLKALFGEEAYRAYSEGYGILINTGIDDTYEEVSKEEAEKEKVEEDDEESEGSGVTGGGGGGQGHEWSLPKPTDARIGITGAHHKYVQGEDKEVSPQMSEVDWLDLVEEKLINTTSGQMHMFRQYRAKKNPGRCVEIREEALKLVPSLKRRIQMAIEAQARVGRERNLKRGTIDAGRAHTLVSSGRGDIFAKKSYKKDIKAAISVVIDDSGSMGSTPGRGFRITRTGVHMRNRELLESKAGCAAVLAYTFGEVCRQLNLPLELISYQKNFMGWSDHYSVQYKAFHEPWDAVKDRLGNYIPSAGVDVPYEAGVFAANRLKARKEDLKILFFMTDATPGNVGIERMGDLAKELETKLDIKMIGISILTEFLKHFMKDRAEAILKLEDLNDVVFTKLAKLIHPV